MNKNKALGQGSEEVINTTFIKVCFGVDPFVLYCFVLLNIFIGV